MLKLLAHFAPNLLPAFYQWKFKRDLANYKVSPAYKALFKFYLAKVLLNLGKTRVLVTGDSRNMQFVAQVDAMTGWCNVATAGLKTEDDLKGMLEIVIASDAETIITDSRGNNVLAHQPIDEVLWLEEKWLRMLVATKKKILVQEVVPIAKAGLAHFPWTAEEIFLANQWINQNATIIGYTVVKLVDKMASCDCQSGVMKEEYKASETDPVHFNQFAWDDAIKPAFLQATA